MLRCAPEHVRALTDDQQAAIRFLPVEAVAASGRYAKRGAQTFIDITKQTGPTEDDEMEIERELAKELDQGAAEEPPEKRQRRENEDEDIGDELPPIPEDQPWDDGLEEGEIDEEVTTAGEPMARRSTSTSTNQVTEPVNRTVDIAGNAYGPIRTGESSNELTGALQRSVELLDLGTSRHRPQPYSLNQGDERTATPDSSAEVFTVEDLKRTGETCDRHFETFMAQDKRSNELRDRDLFSDDDQRRVRAGRLTEIEKLIRTKSLMPLSKEEADEVRKTIDSRRLIDSRFVKTRRASPDNPEESEIKCRLVAQGYKDPDLDHLERQSPTLTADGLSVVLQIIASMKWTLEIADVEGAFLQGEPLRREAGRLFLRVPREGIDNYAADDLFEIRKCIYGLMDAPLKWWRSISARLQQLGCKQSELDPCCFFGFIIKSCLVLLRYMWMTWSWPVMLSLVNMFLVV